MSEAILPRPQGLNSRGISVSLLLARRGARLRAVLPHREQHRPLCTVEGHSLPGTRQRGEQRRLLRARSLSDLGMAARLGTC